MTVAPAVRRAPRELSFLVVAMAVLVAACGTPATPTPAPSAPPATASPGGEPSPTNDPAGAPTEPPPGQATEPPAGEPSPEPVLTPAPTGTPGDAAVCGGSKENRAFFAAVAEAVAWDVYCAVLPAGWFIDTGSFRLAAGGHMEIAYKGPGGMRLEVREGHYCAGDDDCILPGPDAGPAFFGDRPARLVDAGGGAWLVVAEGGDVNWEAKGSGMDATVLTGLTAAFARVDE
ncbi:MAG TPA: hypothetical protein VLM76_01270 [Patescibacteria group bacterium]|nr:hypothetical protein [Patescibacteria group bacterium]